jgi:hypothetical protein
VSQALVDAGHVRAIGVCNFTEAHLDALLPHCRIRPAVNQVELHPYLPQDALVAYCQARGIHVTAYSSLGSGGTPSLLQDPTVRPSPVHDASVRACRGTDTPPRRRWSRWRPSSGAHRAKCYCSGRCSAASQSSPRASVRMCALSVIELRWLGGG